MSVTECDVPSDSMRDPVLIERGYFHDSYRVPVKQPGLAMVDIFFALLGHTPFWMKASLIVRNAVARRFGLEAPSVAEIMKPAVTTAYAVGEKIGPWPVFSIGVNEIVAGRDNRHLDFRLSVLRVRQDGRESVVVSTVCSVHNLFGKPYLFLIVPFHRFGVQMLMSRAVAQQRL